MTGPVEASSRSVQRSVTGGVFRQESRAVIGLTIVSLFAAQAEAMALVLLVPLAQAVSTGADIYTGKIGPFSLDASVDVLALVCALGILSAASLNVVDAVVRGSVVSRHEGEIRAQLLDEYLGASWPTMASSRGGGLPTIASYASRSSGLLSGLIVLIKSGFTVLIFLATAFLVNVVAAVMTITVGLVLFAALRPLASAIRRINRRTSSLWVEYSEEMAEVASAARDIRVYTAEGAISARIGEMNGELCDLRRKETRLGLSFNPAYQYSGMLLVVAVIVFARRMSGVDVAQVGAIALLLLRTLNYGQQLQSGYQNIVGTVPYVEDLNRARQRFRMDAISTTGDEVPAVERLDFQGVCYSYDGEANALDGVSFAARAGELIGVAGPSGGGKSTLSQILLRLRVPDSGQVLINGRIAEEYALDSWYRRISYVPQDPRLLHASVAENISMFDPDVEMSEVKDAARAAGIHEVIESLPEGYNTLIGPAFRDLSGGQIQRIGIARALARRAEVLILDEPTSALDVQSEAIIQDTLLELKGKVLLIVIAHRLTTLTICDKLLVMRHGRVESFGEHDEAYQTSEFLQAAAATARTRSADVVDEEVWPT